MNSVLKIVKDHKLDVARIVVLALIVLGFFFGLPLQILFIGILFGVFGLAKDAIVDLIKEWKVGTEVYITVAVTVALLGQEYSAAGIVLLIILIAEFIGDVISERARSSIKSLVEIMPKTAILKNGAIEKEVAIEDLKIGDIVIIRAGDKVPVDGIVLHGDGAVNQATITGENMPQEKVAGSEVYAGTILQSGALDIQVTKLKADTMFAHIIRLVEEAQEKEAPIQKLTDKVAAYLIPISFIFVLGVYLYTRDVSMIIALLIFTSPAELALATPLVMVAGIARAAREGILLKGGIFLEELSHISTFIFDKTGTLTEGKPKVTEVKALGGFSDEQIIALAAAADRRSNHPLAIAVVAYAKVRNIPFGQPTAFEVVRGRGIVATVDGKSILLGNEALLREKGVPLQGVSVSAEQTVVYIAIDGRFAGTISIADEIRESAKNTITALKQNGVERIIMLTGDGEASAKHVADILEIEYRANLLPEDKIAAVKEFQKDGTKVAMIGDGINDAPALAQANVGIAMGAMGNEAAMDAADVVLVSTDLSKIATVRKLSQRAYRTIKENIFVGVGVVHVAGITLVLTGVIGPVQAAAFHLVPDVLVFLNSTKLLKIKL
ncbi:MAG: heavy metal translocating P-type ATPase [Minisyncoccota bacterium]